MSSGPIHDPLPERRSHFLYVLLPEDIEPDERHDRYATSLDAELRLAGLGEVTGGGTMMLEDDGAVLFCGIDVDTFDIDAARVLLRDHLPGLGCRCGTLIEYRVDGEARCDRFDGDAWWLAEEPTA